MTSTQNRSQQLFEEFCSSSSIPAHPIPQSKNSGEKTPDYDVFFSGFRVVVEVKQLEPNPLDQQHMDRFMRTNRTGTYTLQPGHRVRKAIDEAMPQLKAWSCGAAPTMLVLFNNIPLPFPYLDPEHVLAGMYGMEEVKIIAPDPRSSLPLQWFHKFGGKRRVSPTFNTTLSALAVLFIESDRNLINVYHNDYASKPLDPEWLRNPFTRHFKLGPVAETGGLRTWKEL